MNALKSKSRRFIPTILTFVLGSYDINACSEQLELTIKPLSTLSAPLEPKYLLAILFTRLNKEHIHKLPNVESPLPLEIKTNKFMRMFTVKKNKGRVKPEKDENKVKLERDEDKAKLEEAESKVKLKEVEITQLKQATGLNDEKIHEILALANALRSNGQRPRDSIESRAFTIAGEKLYKSLNGFRTDSSFDCLIEFIQSEDSPFLITITSPS